MANAGAVASELRELTAEELVLRLKEYKEELFNLRFQMATGQLDNNRRLRTVRTDIARIYTIMRERELGLSGSPDDRGRARGPQEARPLREGPAQHQQGEGARRREQRRCRRPGRPDGDPSAV